MNREQRMVRDWHRRFGVVEQQKPQNVNNATFALRYDLIREELSEFQYAGAKGDLVGVADALADLLYVVYGTAVSYGIDMEPIFTEVHSSNMSKGNPEVLRAPNGKILKAVNYTPPNIAILIAEQQKRPLDQIAK